MVKWQLFAHKSMKVRNIKDDSLVDPYIQELEFGAN
jgi:hypothetical protein